MKGREKKEVEGTFQLKTINRLSFFRNGHSPHFLSHLAKYITYYYAEQPFWRLFWRGCLSFFALIIFSSSSGTFPVRLKTIINAKGGDREHNTPGFRCILSVLMDRRTPPSPLACGAAGGKVCGNRSQAPEGLPLCD